MTSSKIRLTLPKKEADFFKSLGEHLRHSGRFSLPERLERMVSEFIEYQITCGKTVLPAGSKYYRARLYRVGQATAFPSSEMGAPPQGQARSGRINPDGISYLYLSDSPETAIAEVRPWKGARVAVGKFTVSHNLEVVTLGSSSPLTPMPKSETEVQENLRKSIFGGILGSMYFATPAHGEDRLAYLPSQYIAEMFKNKGIAGLQYKSVLREGGTNLATFDILSAVCSSVGTYTVKGVSYDTAAEV